LDTSWDGALAGNRLALTIYQTDPNDSSVLAAHLITGVLRADQTFSVDVYDRSLTVVGQLTGTKTSGAQAAGS